MKKLQDDIDKAKNKNKKYSTSGDTKNALKVKINPTLILN